MLCECIVVGCLDSSIVVAERFHMGPCLARAGPSAGPGPFAVYGRPQKKRLTQKSNIPCILKYVILCVLVTFYGTSQIWHSQLKRQSPQEPHRSFVQQDVLYSRSLLFLELISSVITGIIEPCPE